MYIFVLMSISALYILDKKGNVLINRNYKIEQDGEAVEKFQKKWLSSEDQNWAPFVVDEADGCVYTAIWHANILRFVNSIVSFTYQLQCINGC